MNFISVEEPVAIGTVALYDHPKQGAEASMSITCTVFINGSLTGQTFRFASVPRFGDEIQIGTEGRDWILKVDKVVFVAEGVYHESEGDIQIKASSGRA